MVRHGHEVTKIKEQNQRKWKL